jgi:predicted Rossmann-fold nucleotide-binding protein
MMQVSDDSEYWRRLAEEARSEAEQITKPRAKQTMLNVAETYDAMARRAEKKEKPPGKEPSG